MKLCEGGDGLCLNSAEADGLCDEHHHEFELGLIRIEESNPVDRGPYVVPHPLGPRPTN